MTDQPQTPSTEAELDARAQAVEDAMWAAADAIYIPPPTTKAASDMCCDLSVGGTPDYATVEGRDYFLRGLGLIEQQARAEAALAEYREGVRLRRELAAALDETTRMLDYLWTAEGLAGVPVAASFATTDPLHEDVPKVIAKARALSDGERG